MAFHSARNSLSTSLSSLHHQSRYYDSPIIFFGKHKARRIIKELYETVEPNQYARSKSMLPRVLNTIIGKQQPTVSDNLSPNHYRID